MAAKVSGLAVGYTAAGFALLWSGWRNVPLKDTLTSFAKGQVPQGVPTGSPSLDIGPGSATPAGGTGPGSSGGGQPNTGGEPDRTSWAHALLAALGAPQTPANVASLVAWQAREGGGGANNPLNSTQTVAGSTALSGNPDGVQNYPNVAEGISATVITLRNGLYNDILMYLRSGRGFTGVTLAGLSKWSGGGYSSVG